VNQLTELGIGQSTGIGIGGDAIIGTHLPTLCSSLNAIPIPGHCADW
jgi:succinyl-CoA synthetase alpha subunit